MRLGFVFFRFIAAPRILSPRSVRPVCPTGQAVARAKSEKGYAATRPSRRHAAMSMAARKGFMAV